MAGSDDELAEASFHLRYDGPGLATGRMDVHQLAPSLLAIAEILRETNEVLYPGEPAPRIEIMATERGSFLVDLVLSEPGLVEQLASMWHTVRDAHRAVAGILATSMMGMSLALQIEGRRVQRRAEEDGGVVLELQDGTTLTMPTECADLLERPMFWKGAKSLAAPLGEGVTDLQITAADSEPVHIDRDNKRYLDRPVDATVTEHEVELTLRVESVTFAEGRRWRFNDGEVSFGAQINDHDFNTKVMLGGEQFGAGDRLRCLVRVRQAVAPDGSLTTDRTITRVFEHVRGPRQQELPYEEQ